MLALAVPVLLMSRDDFDGGEFPALAAVVAVRRVPAASRRTAS